ncbi:glucosaminidase domain-containing protein [Niabella terrae]
MLFWVLLPTVFCKAQVSEVVTGYIQTYRRIAIEEMRRTGVPAAIKLAQGIHETMAGQSVLVLKSNNHFGIKCKAGYSGPYVLHDDDRRNERFMKYEDPQASYRDHSDFLRRGARYAFLFDLDPLDYKAWAYGLKKAGYATNPRYPQLLIRLIEKYDLQQYTLMALGKMDLPADMPFMAMESAAPEPSRYPEGLFTINGSRVVYATSGTELNSLATQYHTPLEWIYRFNDFSDPAPKLKSNQLVFLQLKRTVGQQDFHEVQAGETLAAIAQQEGIRLESLLRYNRMGAYDRPAPGSRLHLREPGTGVAVN